MLEFQKKNNSQNSILSAHNPNNHLNAQQQVQQGLKNKLKQKQQLIVYLNDNHYFIEHSAAFALGITNVRAIMMVKSKLIELKPEILNKLKNNENLEIIYKMIAKEKQKIQIFVNDAERSITMAAAYSLGLIDEKKFFDSSKKDYYVISEDMINGFKNKFDIEYYSKHLNDEKTNQKKHI